MMPSYWSLGFHLCRYGYTGMQNVEEVFDRNRKAGIPYDTQWADIDYMDQRRDFTYDTVKFSGLAQFAAKLNSLGMKFVVILDPAIASDATNYDPLTTGMTENVFVHDSKGQILEGKVWPGNTYFPDFTRQNAVSWWSAMIRKWHSVVNVDGLWIDMNEPSNFVTGSLSGCLTNDYNNPPFVPLPDQTLCSKTLCMDATQAWGKHYSVHSMYGYAEAIATNKALQDLFPDKRPFVLSRSTYIGAGAYTAHWTGDNNSDWPQMHWSIITILEFQMFGIPFVGADICGFNRDTTEELCTRWMQLGAFYPFSRNHNAINQKAQDPASFSASAVSAMKSALETRYKLLPTLYTLFHFAHTTGSPVVKPLFFQWPLDASALSVDDQFLWGNSLMVVPILGKGLTSRTAYFPLGRWFDYYTFPMNLSPEWLSHMLFEGSEIAKPSAGRSQLLSIPLSTIGLYITGGHILPWQSPSVTTTQSRQNDFGLLVGLDEEEEASGSLFWDDGVSLNTVYKNAYLFLQFNVTLSSSKKSGILSITRTANGYRDTDNLNFTTVNVYGIKEAPIKVVVNGNQIPLSQFHWNSVKKTLTLSGLKIPLSSTSSQTQTVEWFFS